MNLKIPRLANDRGYFAGIIGDKPSRYSKSPAIWNAAFRKIGLDAAYVPFDVDAGHLKTLIQKLEEKPGFLGLNVTIPHKERIVRLSLLDALNSEAKRVKAVNVIARNSKRKLVGYNTDGEGAVRSLLDVLPGQKKPFFKSLSGLTVILLGAGGSARAVAFAVAGKLGSQGRLLLMNRTRKKAEELGRSINKIWHNGRVLKNNTELEKALPESDLLINATAIGQSSFGNERYSALGPMNILRSPEKDLKNNLRISRSRMKRLPPKAKLFDLIYSPAETVFLRQGCATGHDILNGKNMILWQAAASFLILMKTSGLQQYASPRMEKKVLNAMSTSWVS